MIRLSILLAALLSGCAAAPPTTQCKLSWRGDCEQQLFLETK